MSINIEEILSYTIGHNYIEEYSLAFGVFLLTVLVLKIFKYVIITRIKDVTAKTKTQYDEIVIEIIDNIGWSFYVLLSLYVAIKFIWTPVYVNTALYYALLFIVVYYAIKGSQTIIEHIALKIISKRKNKEEEYIVALLSNILKISLWAIAFIFILSNMGYNVSTLIAGIGIGGIAIAFALQNVLIDIFASFSIYFDKPFRIGDFIIVGKDAGTVKKIGIKTTRIGTLSGQELVVSNRDLTSSRINNYKKMTKRRICFTFGVVYETSSEKLRKILVIVKDLFDKIELADFGRVHFKEFADSSLNFEVVYYVNTGDYDKYMDVQQKVNFAIKESLEKEKIEFAYPTQTILVNNAG